jgi:hypothetical protein
MRPAYSSARYTVGGCTNSGLIRVTFFTGPTNLCGVSSSPWAEKPGGFVTIHFSGVGLLAPRQTPAWRTTDYSSRGMGGHTRRLPPAFIPLRDIWARKPLPVKAVGFLGIYDLFKIWKQYSHTDYPLTSTSLLPSQCNMYSEQTVSRNWNNILDNGSKPTLK